MRSDETAQKHEMKRNLMNEDQNEKGVEIYEEQFTTNLDCRLFDENITSASIVFNTYEEKNEIYDNKCIYL